MAKIHVVLVDGRGHPRVVAIEDSPILPIVLTHEIEGLKDIQILVKFARSNGELDPFGRQIYRQKCPGPPPELRAKYLQPRPNLPKLKPAAGTTGE